VSIVINNFNYAHFLPASIESALAQTYPGTEVVVVDDASSDDSALVIRRYGDRIVPVLCGRNAGQGAAINAGIAASQGDVVMLLDADDYLYPQAAERVAAAWSDGVAQVQFRLDLVDAVGTKVDIYPQPEVAFDGGDVVPILLSRGRFETTVTSGTAFGRAALAKILPIPEADFRISADGYLVTVAAFHGRIVSIEEPLGAYRQHGANMWSTATQLDAGALADRFRRSLEHDAQRIRALRGHVAQLGHQVCAQPELSDHRHLSARLASLRLAPGEHPYPDDSRIGLALRGVAASWHASTTLRMRLIFAAWFLAVGLLPRALSRRAVLWRFNGASRPEVVDRLLKLMRRLAR
jgi:hypothetical protein